MKDKRSFKQTNYVVSMHRTQCTCPWALMDVALEILQNNWVWWFLEYGAEEYILRSAPLDCVTLRMKTYHQTLPGTCIHEDQNSTPTVHGDKC